MVRFTFSVDKTFSNNSPRRLESFLDKNFVLRVNFMYVKAKMATTTKQNI